MMHRDDFVVTLRHGDSDKTYREYRNGDIADSDPDKYRFREVSIPYGSEYRFAFKNMKDVRRRIEITIDGTQVGDWVLSAGSKKNPYEAIIERFADSAHKFKIVHPDHPGVADPGSADNGNVVVKVWEEQARFRRINHPSLLWGNPMPLDGGGSRRRNRRSFLKGSSGGILRGSSTKGMSSDSCFRSDVSSSVNLSSTQNCIYSTNSVDLNADDGAAATVEGGHSDQTFTTTRWEGDAGTPLVFEFKISGKGDVENSYSEEEEVLTENLIRIELVSVRDMGRLRKDTKIALEQLGFKLSNTKKNGSVLIGHYDGPVNVLEQLKGVKDVEELLST